MYIDTVNNNKTILKTLFSSLQKLLLFSPLFIFQYKEKKQMQQTISSFILLFLVLYLEKLQDWTTETKKEIGFSVRKVFCEFDSEMYNENDFRTWLISV